MAVSDPLQITIASNDIVSEAAESDAGGGVALARSAACARWVKRDETEPTSRKMPNPIVRLQHRA
jgi:hypothetical protein